MPAVRNHLFLDTETTGTGRDRRIWDVGMVVYDQRGHRSELSYLIADVDLSGADHRTLEYGHFSRRHPLAGGTPESGTEVRPEKDVVREIFRLAYGATVAGIVVNFDTEGLMATFARHNLCWPAWHHLQDVEGWALGALVGHSVHVPEIAQAHAELLDMATQRPPRWTTDDIAEAFRIPAIPAEQRHTAIGDARLAERIHRASIVDRFVPTPEAHWNIPHELLAAA